MTGGIKGRKEVAKKKKGEEEAIHFFGSCLAITPLVQSALPYKVVKTEFRTGNEADLQEDTSPKKC